MVEPEQRISYCRHCPAYCGTAFTVSGNSILDHGPDRSNPNSAGFICVKGEMAVDLLTGADSRLTQCQQRMPDGSFAPVTTSDALDAVAARLIDLIGRYGPDSVALYVGTASYGRALTQPIAKSFLASIGSSRLFSTMTIDQSARWVVAARMGVFATGKPSIEDADLALLSGTNPVVSHIAVTSTLPTTRQVQRFTELRQRGGTLIVIDPRRTETARLADLHLQPRPGFDAAIFASVLHVMLDEGWHDPAFCGQFVANLPALRSAVVDFPPDRVGVMAGVDPADLVQIARLVGRSRRPVTEFGTGTTMANNGDTAVHLFEAIAAIKGGYLRAGDRHLNPGVFAKRALREQVYPPNRMWETGPRLSTGHGRLYGEFPTSQLPAEILSDREDRIRALVVVGANPLSTWGNPQRALKALRQLDLLVTIDPRLTETARESHYVIAPPLQYEVSDINMFNDYQLPRPYVQFAPPVVSAPPGTIPEWKFFHGLAARMNLVLTAKPFLFGVDHADIPGGLRLDPARDWTCEDLIKWYCDSAGLSLDLLQRHPHGLSPDLESPAIAPADDSDPARMDVMPPDVAEELAAIAKATPASSAPYRLTNRRIVETMNTAFRDNARTLRRHDGNSLYMHPDDLSGEGLAAGDAVEIEGAHGCIRAFARADPTMRRGVVAMTHGWGAVEAETGDGTPGAGHVGHLVSVEPEHVQPIDGMPLQSNIPIHIRPLRQASVVPMTGRK